MHQDYTLQINISPGDLAYANYTVRELVRQHQIIPNKLLIVDCCKPQKTKLVDPSLRFPEPAFTQRVKAICELAEIFKNEHLFTDVKILLPEDPIFKLISKKYLSNLIKKTHGAGGTAQMAYWAGIEIPKTRYVIHFDGDMLFYQQQGFQWWKEAEILMSKEPMAFFSIPRNAPCLMKDDNLPTHFEGTEIIKKNTYWMHNWFSTRAFMIDKVKLEKELPLISGKILFQLLLRKLPFRAFPLDPEIILFRKLGIEKGYRRLILTSNKSWMLHPIDKSNNFINLLPLILEKVNQNIVPIEQYYFEDIKMAAWKKMLSE